MLIKVKFKDQDVYEARFRALQIVDERAAVKSVNGVLPDDAGAITLTPADIDAVSVEDVANIRGAFRINVTYSNGVYTADKTFDEIKAAYDAGQQPYVVLTGGALDFVYTLAYFSAPDGTGKDFADFERYLIGEGTLETETLRIYSYITDSGSNIVKRTYSFDAPTGGVTPATTEKLGVVRIGENLKITDAGVLSVDAANAVEQDNTKPITSAAVYIEIGNINTLLETI